MTDYEKFLNKGKRAATKDQKKQWEPCRVCGVKVVSSGQYVGGKLYAYAFFNRDGSPHNCQAKTRSFTPEEISEFERKRGLK